ncbi:MAG: hypothetical protein KTR15_04720 [Phycisphaeraceae bacterium]|nr:hypothetical protein [Phycisphaeraceae bacterium]
MAQIPSSSNLLPVVLLVVVFLVTIAILFAKRGARNAARQSDTPSCGYCGYPTRGISELQCPECGADLRAVGIVLPGEGRSPLAGCLLPLLMTAMLFMAAILGYSLAGLVVPTYRQQSITMYLYPASTQYDHVFVRVEGTLIIPPGTPAPNTGLSMSSTYGPSPVASASLSGFGPNAKPQRISLQATPTSQTIASGGWAFASFFEVDPATGQASWTDAQGKTQSSQGPATDQDVLAYLDALGAEITMQAVIDEAKQLSVLIDGLIQGGNMFTIKGFRSGGSGSGGGQQVGPAWFLPVYAASWVVIWVIALAVIARRGRRSKPGQ